MFLASWVCALEIFQFIVLVAALRVWMLDSAGSPHFRMERSDPLAEVKRIHSRPSRLKDCSQEAIVAP